MRRREQGWDDGRAERAAVAALGPRSRTSRIPVAVRMRVLAYARRERAAGRSWHRIARAVGVSAGSLKNWSQTPPSARTLVPVAVAAPAPEVAARGLVIVSPGGFRLGGVDLPTATALLRALG